MINKRKMEKNEYLVTFRSRSNGSEISSYVSLASDVHDLDYLKYYSYKSIIDDNGFSMVEYKIVSIINRVDEELIKWRWAAMYGLYMQQTGISEM